MVHVSRRMTPFLFILSACTAVSDAQVRSSDSTAGQMTLADSLSTWYALGLNAHHLCAGLWVVGRDNQRAAETVIAQDIAPFPAFRWEDDFSFEVDTAAPSATVKDPRIGSRTARYSGDQGCAILPAGSDDVFFEPVVLRSSPPDASTLDWPMGDRNVEGRFPDVDGAALQAALDWAFSDDSFDPPQHTRGITVVFRDRIIAERYAEGWGPHTPQLSWSMGKSIAATLIGVLIQEGELALDQPTPLPEWQNPEDPRREIRIADLLRMSSGLDFDNFGLEPSSSYSADNEHFRIYFDGIDVRAHAVHQPPRYAPGEVWRYRNSDPLALMAIVRQVVEARGEQFLSFPQNGLFDRIGMRSVVLETDAWGNFIITGYDFGSTRDWARLGLLYLHDGVWQGERILPEGFAEFVSTPAPGDPQRGYGAMFWVNRGAAMDRLPVDAYWAAGYMGQTTMIIPSRNVVIARHGPSEGRSNDYFEELAVRILDALPAAR
jgi:CubicO group peptidase (beta-lactamase class C family)